MESLTLKHESAPNNKPITHPRYLIKRPFSLVNLKTIKVHFMSTCFKVKEQLIKTSD